MARSYVVNGQTLTDKMVPYEPGSDAYYRYIAQWKAKAKGEEYQKSEQLLKLERSLAADKAALPDWQQEQDWKDAHEATQSQYAEEYAKYLQGQGQWEADITDLARQSDRGTSGKAAAGYRKVTNPDGTVSWQYLGAGYDEGDERTDNNDATSILAATGTAIAGQLGGTGKYGGVGNSNSAGPIDNSWNEADGVDVRTEKQRFYDRNLDNIEQQADANGTYSWYGVETGWDANDPKKQRRIDLSNAGSRETAPEGVDYGKGVNDSFDRSEIWSYNGQSGNRSAYDDAVRTRANKSIYARTV